MTATLATPCRMSGSARHVHVLAHDEHRHAHVHMHMDMCMLDACCEVNILKRACVTTLCIGGWGVSCRAFTLGFLAVVPGAWAGARPAHSRGWSPRVNVLQSSPRRSLLLFLVYLWSSSASARRCRPPTTPSRSRVASVLAGHWHHARPEAITGPTRGANCFINRPRVFCIHVNESATRKALAGPHESA